MDEDVIAMIHKKFPERLLAECELRGMTPKELAEFCGIKHMALRNWLSGRNMPYVLQIAELALALDVTIDYLLGLSNSRD